MNAGFSSIDYLLPLADLLAVTAAPDQARGFNIRNP